MDTLNLTNNAVKKSMPVNSDQVLQSSSSITHYNFTVVINNASGSADYETTSAKLRIDSGLKIEALYKLTKSTPIENQMQTIFRHASKQKHAVLVAGGDGTINLAVKYAMRFDVPLALLAQGTFNLFALHHGLSTDLSEAIDQLRGCVLQRVPIAYINDIPFTSSVNMGLYSDMIREREKHLRQTGVRNRITASLIGFYTYITRQRNLKTTLSIDEGSPININAQLIIASQNQPQIENLGLAEEYPDIEGSLLLIIANPKNGWDKLRLLGDRMLGNLAENNQFQTKRIQKSRLNSREKKMYVAIDGEVFKLPTPFQLNVKPKALALFKPVHSQ